MGNVFELDVRELEKYFNFDPKPNISRYKKVIKIILTNL